MNATGDQQLVKRINRSVLLRLIRSQPGLSRAQLSQLSGLTKSTVSNAVRELLDDGWLAETSSQASSKQGRPSTPLSLSTETHVLIGVELGVGCLRLAATSLAGGVLWSLEQELLGQEPPEVCRQISRLVLQAHQEAARRGLQLVGIGVGLPGAYDVATGVLRVAPNLGWRNLPIASMLESALSAVGLADTVLHIQNEADAAALSEYEFGDAGSTDGLIFVTCDVGVGAGIVLNDRLYPGAQGLAGEIGHSILSRDGALCSCGRRGCAETLIGARALERELVQRGNLNLAGEALGILLHNMWTSFNPGAFVLGGKSCVRYPELFDLACTTLAAYAKAAGMPAPTVRVARYGPFAAAAGAAALVLHNFLRPLHAVQRGTPSALAEADVPPAAPNKSRTKPASRLRQVAATVAAE